MRVCIIGKSGYVNPRRGLDLKCGETVELPDDLAVKLFTHRIAEPAPAPVIETVAAAPPANTAKRVSKPRTRTTKR